ncbi:hypothetical protein CSOJ01_15563 [Colletotrichum sojae]|uniref:Uncharacterized protein n=1 Tax=Colletotrichum sojae TaxID=2175907 RepID=A0A8H6IMW8_9PEZI|nr:hypothetical protein CSOJ01_15563 [Colletotrichum sojae]
MEQSALETRRQNGVQPPCPLHDNGNTDLERIRSQLLREQEVNGMLLQYVEEQQFEQWLKQWLEQQQQAEDTWFCG